jgi:hypothetical protein
VTGTVALLAEIGRLRCALRNIAATHNTSWRLSPKDAERRRLCPTCLLPAPCPTSTAALAALNPDAVQGKPADGLDPAVTHPLAAAGSSNPDEAA